jgi:signal transduction histidine kinase/PAS domain-containing protein
LSIKAKQVAGVTTLVVMIVLVLSAFNLATLTRMSLQETVSRGELLANTIFQRAHGVVVEGVTDPYTALRQDGGIRSLLESSIAYSPNVSYAAIASPQGVAVAHSFRSEEGRQLEDRPELKPIVDAGPLAAFRAVFSEQTYEVRLPVLFGDQQGAIRIGVSTLLVRSELEDALKRTGQTLLATLLISTLVAMLLAQWMLRPIHVIQSGLTRLGRGELDVRLDLREEEFKDLGSSFAKVSEQLASLGRSGANATPQSATDLESVMENLEDGVALFAPSGELIFCNPAMRALSPGDITSLPSAHPVRRIVEQTLAGHKGQGPVAATFETDHEPTERLLLTHAIEDSNDRFLGAMLVARNLGYLSQVQTTLNYSRKLAALGRLMAGVAHEVKNPLNAMTIHLELLKQKLAKIPEAVAVAAGGPAPARSPDPTKHVNIIGDEIRRLDQVLNGFLKFARPDELKLEPVHLESLISDVTTSVLPDAEQRRVHVKTECPADLPEINADLGMLRQALLNLAINACQAMPDGGTLRIAARATAKRRVEVDVEDTGVGIPPEHLSKIFDLYFTTKERGSGIGLSMVYRIVQLHDGEVEVQSTPGRGTRFRLIFPQA